MKRRARLLLLLPLLLCVLIACGPGSSAEQEANVESERDRVVTFGADGQQQVLPASQETSLAVGGKVDVDERGRAIVRFSDLLTVEVLRDGDLVLKHLSVDEQSAFITVAQGGGVLVNDFDPQKEIESRFTVETEFATITATGTRFVVALDANGDEAWVVGLEAEAQDLRVTARGVTQAVASGKARSVQAGGEPGAEVGFDPQAVEGWLERLRESELPQREPEAGEVIAPAPSGIILEGKGKLDRANEAFYPFSVPPGVVLSVELLVAKDEEESGVYAGLYQAGSLLDRISSPDRDGYVEQGESGAVSRVFSSEEGGEYELRIYRGDGSPEYEFVVSAVNQRDGGQVGDAGDNRETARPVEVNASEPYRGRLGNRDEADVYFFEFPAGVVLTIEVWVAEDEEESAVEAGLYQDGSLLYRISSPDRDGYVEQGEGGAVTRVFGDEDGGEYELRIYSKGASPAYEFRLTTGEQ